MNKLFSLIPRIVKLGIIEHDRPRDLRYQKRLSNLIRKLRILDTETNEAKIGFLTGKVVLILGRFTPERKAILDAIREELRKRNYTPVLFDFEKPANRDLTETVSTLAHLARFIIVDLTDPSSAPHEVATIIPHCVVPVQPLLLKDDAKP